MKTSHKLLYLLLLLFMVSITETAAQTANDYFNRSAKQYVNSDLPGAGQILAEGLQKFPDDAKLNALLEKMKKDEEDKKKQNEQDQDQQDQQQDPNKQEEEDGENQKDGEGEEQTQEDNAEETDKNEDQSGEKSSQEEPVDEPSDQESDLSEREKAMEDMRQRLEDMNITPEQAAQILDAMNNAELQYIQQNRRKPTQRPQRGLPDW